MSEIGVINDNLSRLFQEISKICLNVSGLKSEIESIKNNVSTLSFDFKNFRKETKSHLEKIDVRLKDLEKIDVRLKDLDDLLYGIKRRINELEDDSDFLRSKMKGIQQTNSYINAGKDIQYLYSRKSEANSISNPDIDD